MSECVHEIAMAIQETKNSNLGQNPCVVTLTAVL